MLKKAVRSSLSSFFDFGARFFGSNHGTRILCYHSVSDTNQHYVTVSVSEFEKQMKYLKEAGYRTVSLYDLLQGKTGDKDIVVTFDDGYRDNYENAFAVMKKYGFKGTIFCISELLETREYLNLEQIREMRQSGFDFGSHTIRHSNLKNILREKKKVEIWDSKRLLKKQIGCEIDFFCYPYGVYDREAIDLVKSAGYLAACSNRPGTNQRIDPFRLRRTEIGFHDSIDDFKKKLGGGYDLIHQGLHLLRGRP